jgi:hypothetical protein
MQLLILSTFAIPDRLGYCLSSASLHLNLNSFIVVNCCPRFEKTILLLFQKISDQTEKKFLFDHFILSYFHDILQVSLLTNFQNLNETTKSVLPIRHFKPRDSS